MNKRKYKESSSRCRSENNRENIPENKSYDSSENM
jgi:hypothetical protein